MLLLFLKKDIIVARSEKEIGMDNFVAMLKEVGSWAITEGIKVLVGVILLFILFKITNFFTRRFDKLLNRKMIEPTIVRVVVPTTRRVVKFVLVLIFLDYLGIQTASITAAIASAGVAIGLALQGSLSNLAGGIVILVMHPYKIGDYVQCDGYEGTVTDIKLFYTYLKTGDNKVVGTYRQRQSERDETSGSGVLDIVQRRLRESETNNSRLHQRDGLCVGRSRAVRKYYRTRVEQYKHTGAFLGADRQVLGLQMVYARASQEGV